MMVEKFYGIMFFIFIVLVFGDFVVQGVKVYKDGKFIFNIDQVVEIIQKYVEFYVKKVMLLEVLQNNYFGNLKLFFQDKVVWIIGLVFFFVDFKKSVLKFFFYVVMIICIGVFFLFVQGICVFVDLKNFNLVLVFV